MDDRRLRHRVAREGGCATHAHTHTPLGSYLTSTSSEYGVRSTVQAWIGVLGNTRKRPVPTLLYRPETRRGEARPPSFQIIRSLQPGCAQLPGAWPTSVSRFVKPEDVTACRAMARNAKSGSRGGGVPAAPGPCCGTVPLGGR